MDGHTLTHSSPSRKDFIDTADFDQSEIKDIIDTSRIVRDYIKSGKWLHSLYHKSLGMIFVPVINGMSDRCHPTQGIGDMITIFDNLPAGKEMKDIKVIFVGDATQVCNTLCDMTTKMGMNFVHYGPANHKISDEWLEIGKKNAEKYGGSVAWSEDPECLKDADFIYTDVWYGLYDKETPKEVYMADFYPKYQVNDEMMAATGNPNCKFLHCLPASRNEEVTDSVLDSPNSLAWDEAENRLTAQRGLLLYFSGVAQATLDYIKQQKEAN